eukprot:GHVR01020853.1.p1 GENE.GHVR01020853.1~~GHVR01020853.1.p1  ORF type:complete len:117 (-),score=7.07 GHVR01020853.1:753-1103(-)
MGLGNKMGHTHTPVCVCAITISLRATFLQFQRTYHNFLKKFFMSQFFQFFYTNYFFLNCLLHTYTHCTPIHLSIHLYITHYNLQYTHNGYNLLSNFTNFFINFHIFHIFHFCYTTL